MVTLGVQYDNLLVVMAGRFVFGLGGETLVVGQTAFAAKWFKARILLRPRRTAHAPDRKTADITDCRMACETARKIPL